MDRFAIKLLAYTILHWWITKWLVVQGSVQG